MKSLRQIREFVVNKFKSSKQCHPWIYREHVLVVETYAKQFLKLYPQANRTIVLLAVWFHDLARADGQQQGHDVLGAEYAKEFLDKEGFDKKTIKAVCHACKTHSCDQYRPQTLEAKILSTADALAHFHKGFYLLILSFQSKRLGYEKAREKLFKKIDRDYHDKICFDKVRKKVKPMYQAWQKVIEEIKLNEN